MSKSAEKIHVLYIITKLELGGAQKVCLALKNGMHEHRIISHLMTGSQGELVSTVANTPHTILINSMQREINAGAIKQELNCLRDLIKEIKKLKQQHPDLIVHTHSTKAGIFGRWAALFAGVKTRIHTVHGYAFHAHQPLHKWLAIYLCELITSLITTRFVCVSSADAKTGIKLFPRFAKKVTIIRASVDTHRFIPAKNTIKFPESKPFIFGTIACFKPQKNMFDLLQAFAYVHKHNSLTRLEIIGDGVLRPQIEAWIEERSLETAIILHGWQKNVVPIMQNWNAFTLSSLWEGLPCAIVEARLLKLPVLCYNTGGISDVIQHGKNGYLYAQKDWKGLACGMLELTKDAATHNKLSGYDDNFDEFTLKVMVYEHAQLYKQFGKK